MEVVLMKYFFYLFCKSKAFDSEIVLVFLKCIDFAVSLSVTHQSYQCNHSNIILNNLKEILKNTIAVLLFSSDRLERCPKENV